MDGIPQRALHADLREQLLGLVRHLDVLFLRADVEDLANLPLRIGLRGDDKHTVQQIERDTVGALVVGASDICDSSIRGHDDDWRRLRLKGPVKKRETFDVQHVNLVDEQHPGHNVCLALLAPFRDLCIDLLPDLPLNLASVTGEECEEALLPAVDHIDLMQVHRVHHLFPLLQLTLRALHEARLRPHRIVVAGSGEGATEQRNLPRRLVDCDDVTCLDALFLYRFYHLLAQVVHGFHLCCLQRHLSESGSLPVRRALDLDLHHLALDQLGFLPDPHPDRSPESLRQGLRLAHLQGEDLRASQAREGCVLSQRLRHAHGDRGLAGPRLAGDEDRPPGDFALLDHGEDDACRPPRAVLPHHALGDHACVQGVVQAEAPDVRVGPDPLQAVDISDLRDLLGVCGRHGLRRRRLACAGWQAGAVPGARAGA
mmetsp:Transcript_97037/g.274490  ORF Transcript_97037/g.274490 Transcript_97037/m.274490 type:complete len:428 (-) Transcript_97037:7-1290(-)